MSRFQQFYFKNQNVLIRNLTMSRSSKKKNGKTLEGKNVAENCAVRETKDGGFSISLSVKPGAKTSQIVGIDESSVSLQIAAPPVDGEANTAIIKFFSQLLNVRKSEIELKGGKSREKTLIIKSDNKDLNLAKILAIISSQD